MPIYPERMNRDIRHNADPTVTVTDTCVICHQLSSVTVPLAGWMEWVNGAMVQDAFPDLSDDDRETFISGIHGKCYDREFGGG